MNRHRLPVIVAAILLTTGGAHAQNFFERLFGITPSQPPQPAYNQPSAPPALPSDGPGPDEIRRPSPPPIQARPVSIKAPSEETVIGRELKQNGTNGTLRLDRSGGDMRMRMTLVGRRAPQSIETCSVPLGGADGLSLVSLGRPEGTPRYQAQDATCPLQLDIVDEAILVKGPAEVCVFASAGCQAEQARASVTRPCATITRF